MSLAPVTAAPRVVVALPSTEPQGPAKEAPADRFVARLRSRGAGMGKGLLIGGLVVGVGGMVIGGLVGAYVDPLTAGALALGGGYVGSKVGMVGGAAVGALMTQRRWQ